MKTLLVLGAAAALAACASSDETQANDESLLNNGESPARDGGPLASDDEPQDGLPKVALVASVDDGAFTAPQDAVASVDGSSLFFSAFQTVEDAGDDLAQGTTEATVYRVDTAGGAPEPVFGGGPLVQADGLLMSCDGTFVYIIDSGHSVSDHDDAAPIYQLELSTGDLSPLSVDNLGIATGAALSTDCSRLYVGGFHEDGDPVVLTTGPAGGASEILIKGEPLEAPSGIFVDRDHVAWVMDYVPSSHDDCTLWAVDEEGSASAVIEGLQTGHPAGVSLDSSGETAVIPHMTAAGDNELITVHLPTGDTGTVDIPGAGLPSGIRTAREAAVLALVTEDGIYRAQ